MTKLIDRESIPPDDPFFNGSVELFWKHAYKPPSGTGRVTYHVDELHSKPDAPATRGEQGNQSIPADDPRMF